MQKNKAITLFRNCFPVFWKNGLGALFTKQHVSSMEIVELNNSTINSKTREIIYKDVGGQANNT